MAHPVVNTYWQPVHGAGLEINSTGIDMILPWIPRTLFGNIEFVKDDDPEQFFEDAKTLLKLVNTV